MRSDDQDRSSAPPSFTSTEDYANRLTDVAAWAPYARAVLDRHGYASGGFEAGFAGTYPVLLSGPVVVKFFGYFGAWRRSYRAELAATASATAYGAPAVLASGSLFPELGEPWPYLVLERLAGSAWRDASLTAVERRQVAVDLGRQLSAIHRVVIDPDELHDDWLVEQGRAAPERHRQWGSLPAHLVDQIDGYLRDYRPRPRCLLHADLTEDHVFVGGGDLLGIIDWGDAMVSDPHYELAALHLDTFGGDPTLLRAFLDGYGWPVDRDFARRALQTALMHRFDVLAGVRPQAAGADTLEDLAERLWL